MNDYPSTHIEHKEPEHKYFSVAHKYLIDNLKIDFSSERGFSLLETLLLVTGTFFLGGGILSDDPALTTKERAGFCIAGELSYLTALFVWYNNNKDRF